MSNNLFWENKKMIFRNEKLLFIPPKQIIRYEQDISDGQKFELLATSLLKKIHNDKEETKFDEKIYRIYFF